MPTDTRNKVIVENIEEIFLNIKTIKGDKYLKALQLLLNQFVLYRIIAENGTQSMMNMADLIIATSIDIAAAILEEKDTDSLLTDYKVVLGKVYGFKEEQSK